MRKNNVFKKVIAVVISLAMIMSCIPAASHIAKAEETDTKQYTELTFKDIGLDGTYTTETNAIITMNDNNDAAPLDGVAISGYLTYSENATTNTYIKLASGNAGTMDLTPISLFISGGNLYAWDNIGTNHHVCIGEVTAGTRFKIRITFDYSGDDVIIKYYLNDNESVEHTYTDFVKGITTSWGTAKVGAAVKTVVNSGESIKIESEKTNYKIVTFHDFGMPDKTYMDEDVMSGSLDNIESFNNISIQGVINLPQNTGDNYIRFGGKKGSEGEAISVFHQDNGIWLWDCTGSSSNNHVHIDENSDTNKIYYNKDINFRMDMKCSGNGLFLFVSIDGEHAISRYFENIVPNLGTTMAVSTKAETGLKLKSTGDYKHTLAKHDAVEATSCKETGNEEYYTCDKCKMMFSDAEGTKEITEVPVTTGDHKITKHNACEATCTAAGHGAYYECNECRKLFSDADGKNQIDNYEVYQKHTQIYVKEKEATYTSTGTKAHYKCSCGKLYSDKECKNVITEAELIIEKKKEEPTTKKETPTTVVKKENQATQKLPATKLKKLSAKSKAIKVTWTKKSGITGY